MSDKDYKELKAVILSIVSGAPTSIYLTLGSDLPVVSEGIPTEENITKAVVEWYRKGYWYENVIFRYYRLLDLGVMDGPDVKTQRFTVYWDRVSKPMFDDKDIFVLHLFEGYSTKGYSEFNYFTFRDKFDPEGDFKGLLVNDVHKGIVDLCRENRIEEIPSLNSSVVLYKTK